MSAARSSRLSPPSSNAPWDAPTLVWLFVLLLVPAYAVYRMAADIDWRIPVGAFVSFSAWAFLATQSDKRRAEAGLWRIPETTLHLLELLGGWPGAFLAQRRYRHKTAKLSYQFVFWIIVLLHQGAAADSLIDWRYTRQLAHSLQKYGA